MQDRCVDHNQVGNKGGYGKGVYDGKPMLLHRITYCFNNRVNPECVEGYVIRHTCDNPRCVNPKHLVLGTQQENIQDRVNRNRSNKPVGTSNPNVTLSQADVEYIKANYVHRDKEFGCTGLGRKFGVTHQAIRSVVNNISWVEEKH